MDALEAIHTRRSIRSYTSAPVTETDVLCMLEAAMAAPSAGNAQDYHFIVLTDLAVLEQIPAIHPYASMAAKAPLAILVCGDTAAEKYPGFWVQDGAAATQNLLLAARTLGIGTVWCGIHPVVEREQAFQKLCNLPETVRPLCLVVAGYPTQPFARRDTFDATKIHSNTW